MKTLKILLIFLLLLTPSFLFSEPIQIELKNLREFKLSDEVRKIEVKDIEVNYTNKYLPENQAITSGDIIFKKKLFVHSINVYLIIFDESKEPIYFSEMTVSRKEGKGRFLGIYENNDKFKYYVLVFEVKYLKQNDLEI